MIPESYFHAVLRRCIARKDLPDLSEGGREDARMEPDADVNAGALTINTFSFRLSLNDM